MLPTNVMSFVKKIVSSGTEENVREKGSVKSKQGTMSPVSDSQTKIGTTEKSVTSPAPEGADISHLTTEEIIILQKVFKKQQQFEKEEASRKRPETPTRSVSRSNACRICLKGLVAASDVFHVCCECQQKVCEDCSSYSLHQGDTKDVESSWRCSICRRKQADLQKMQDPEVTSRILQRTASRKATGNGAAAMQQSVTAITQMRMCSEFSDKIETAPKLRPRTLDTSGCGTNLGLNPASSAPSMSFSKDVLRASRERGLNTDSAPQTPVQSRTRDDSVRHFASGGNCGSLDGSVGSSSSNNNKRSHHRSSKPVEFYLSDDNPTDNSNSLPVHHPALRHVNSDSVMQHRLSPEVVKGRYSPRPRHSPSTSDSSLDDSWKDDSKDHEHWKRKKSKIKRRTRMQRQRSYHDEHEIDSMLSNAEQRYSGSIGADAKTSGGGGGPSSRGAGGGGDEDSEGAIIGDYGYEQDYRNNSREQLLDVPGHSRIFRHHSWDATLSARRYSSESSDISDVSVDCGGSLDQDELMIGGSGGGGSGSVIGGCGGPPPLASPRSPHLKPKAVRKLARKKHVDSEDDYDAEQSGTMESSPSPEHQERHCFPHIDRRTSSEDSDVFKGKSSRRSSQNSVPGGGGNVSNGSMTNWPGKIPTVEVQHITDHEILGDLEQSIKCEPPPPGLDRMTSVSSSSTTPVSGVGGGRALPRIPSQASSVCLTPTALPPGTSPRTRQSKSVDLTPLGGHHGERNNDNLLRRSTLSDFENVKIIIDDVDSDRKDKPIIQRKVILSRISTDGCLRTRGFGMRVVGGKIGEDGKLFAYVVWTVPGGPAEENGIVKGDKILQWDGETLIDRTFEEVCVIMDRSSDEVTLVVEHIIDPRNCQSVDFIQRRASEGMGLEILAKESKSGGVISSPIRRKLPKPPEQPKEHVSGDIQLTLWYDGDQKLLTITVIAADNLPVRSDSKTHPEAYAKIRLLPDKNKCTFKTPIAEPSTSPTWNENFNYLGVASDDVMDKFLIVSVWDCVSSHDKRPLGEVVVQLKKCELDGRTEWYRLREGCTLTTSASVSSLSKSLHVPPPTATSSAAKDFTWKKKSDFLHTRSLSDDIDDDLALQLIGHIVKSSSVDSNLLHPEQAWSRQGRRRSSSGSEKDQSDTSTHSCPYSLPSTRKNSYNLDPQLEYVGVSPSRDRLRSRSFKMPKQEPLRDQRNKENVSNVSKSSDRLSRSLSLRTDRRSLSLVNVSDVVDPSPQTTISTPSLSITTTTTITNDDGNSSSLTPNHLWKKEYLALPSHGKWSSSSSLEASDEEDYCGVSCTDDRILSEDIAAALHLGPGQMFPKNFTGNLGSNQREIKLGIIITKGLLEIDVICARGLCYSSTGQPPDTYVKMYIKEGEKRMQKKKTRVVKHSTEPQFRQMLTYPAGEIAGRFLLVMVWERQKGFDHNHGIGVAQINPDKLELNKLVIGWYRLFPMGKIESESNEST